MIYEEGNNTKKNNNKYEYTRTQRKISDFYVRIAIELNTQRIHFLY